MSRTDAEMGQLVRLRFKIVTSFVIASLGIVMMIRLTQFAPMRPESVILFIAPLLFVVAGVWRGVIFLRAARHIAKP